MPYVSIRTIPKGDDLYLQRGDTWNIEIRRVGDISARTKLWFSLKSDVGDTDAQSLVQIEETAGLEYVNGAAATVAGNGSITVLDATIGNIDVRLEAVESAKLENVGNFYYDAQTLDTDIETKVHGRAVVMGDVTRETS